MRIRTTLGLRGEVWGIVFLVALMPVPAVAQNLLENPSAETGDLSGWDIIEESGGGWSAGPSPYGLSSSLGGGVDGCAMFFTDDEWCKRSQTIDLIAAGYTETQLDAAPDITVSEWFRGFTTFFTWPDEAYEDTAYLTVKLLAADQVTVIASYESGEFITNDTWVQKTHTFSDYGANVRYVYWEDGGKGVQEEQDFRDGPLLDAASLTIDIASAESPTLSVTADSVDFGTFPRNQGWSLPQTVTIANTGTAPMAVNFCFCGGPGDNVYDFALQNVPANDPIPPGGSVDLEVVFRPIQLGSRQATLRVYSDDPNEPTTPIAFVGEGVHVCTGITRADASPTLETTVRFNVTFNEDVSGVDADDFAVVESGVSGSAITNVADNDGESNDLGKNWLVTVTIGSGKGTVGIELIDDDTIVSGPADRPLGGVGLNNGDFTSGETYQYLGSAQAFYVDDDALGVGDGSSANPFGTIGEAISNASAGRGDIVIVRPGTYSEQVVLKEGVLLESTGGSYHTHITGSGANQHVVTAAEDCVIRGFTISDAGTEAAVFVPESTDCAVTNCVLSDSGKGLLAAAGAVAVFENNTVYGNATYGLRGETGARFDSVQNNIFCANGTAFSADSGGVASSGYNCFFDNTTDYNGPPGAGTDFSADPLFVDAASANFHLEGVSPCRDAGNPDPSYDDKDGTDNDVGADGGPNGVRDTVAPTVSFSASPLSGDAPLLVDMDATASTDEWGIANYSWDFGDESAVQVDTVGTAQHTYTEAGTFTVEVAVQDNSGLSSQATKQILVNTPGNEPPENVSAGASPRAGALPFEVTFTGGGSDPDGGTVEFFWDFGTGQTSDLQNPVHTYPVGTARGSYEATLTVTDDEDVSAQDSLYLTITQEEPVVASVINPAAVTTVTVNDGGSAINGAQVVVPSGATAEPLVIAIGMVPEGGVPTGPRGAVSEVVEVGPEGAAFSTDVTVRIPLSISVPDGSEVRAAVYDEEGGFWSTTGVSNVQFVAGDPAYVTFKTGHFSFYALFLPPTGTDINRDGLVNAVDVQLAVNGVLQLEVEPWMDTDVNGSGETGAEDVQSVVNAALNP